MSLSCLTARGVSPSPQVFSRGNCLRSTHTTSWPASANQYDAAAPAGPPPTTSTSWRSGASVIGTPGRWCGRHQSGRWTGRSRPRVRLLAADVADVRIPARPEVDHGLDVVGEGLEAVGVEPDLFLARRIGLVDDLADVHGDRRELLGGEAVLPRRHHGRVGGEAVRPAGALRVAVGAVGSG